MPRPAKCSRPPSGKRSRSGISAARGASGRWSVAGGQQSVVRAGLRSLVPIPCPQSRSPCFSIKPSYPTFPLQPITRLPATLEPSIQFRILRGRTTHDRSDDRNHDRIHSRRNLLAEKTRNYKGKKRGRKPATQSTGLRKLNWPARRTKPRVGARNHLAAPNTAVCEQNDRIAQALAVLRHALIRRRL